MSELIESLKENFFSLPLWGKAAIGVAAFGGTSIVLTKLFWKGRKSPYKTDYKKDVVYVYQSPRNAALPSISPFSMKLETWLRMANINYENVEISLWVKSKEGMLPFVELNGVEYDDSSFIMRDLTKVLKKEYVENGLSVEQKSVSRAFEQMIDNSTFPSVGYVRLEHLEDYLDSKILGFRLPFMLRLFLPLWKREGRRRLWGHGIGRHPPHEIIGVGLDDLKCISTYLSTRPFFHGDQPTRVDAVLFGYLAQILYIPIDTPHKKLLETECRNLVRYCDRMKAKYWPDWDEICTTRALNTWTGWKK